MKANLIRFEVGAPRVGWTQVNVTSGDFHWKFLASRTPWDSIGDFATAANDLAVGRSGSVKWHIDPGVFMFRFAAQGDRALFEIHEFMDWDLRRPARPGPVFSSEYRTKALASAMWRGLRRLEGVMEKEAYAREWGHPFPSEKIKRLGAAIRQKKSPSEDSG